MNAWVCRTASVLSLAVAISVGGATGARAEEPCPLLDPTCLDETVEDVVDDVTDTVDETVDEVTDTVDETVDEVTDPDGGDRPDDPSEDPADGGGNGGDQGGQGGSSFGDGGTRTGPGGPSLTTRPAVHAARSPIVAPERPWVHGRAVAASWITSGTLFARTAVGIGAMVILLGLVVAFVTFQHALDRRDPKLTVGALGNDEAPFA